MACHDLVYLWDVRIKTNDKWFFFPQQMKWFALVLIFTGTWFVKVDILGFIATINREAFSLYF